MTLSKAQFGQAMAEAAAATGVSALPLGSDLVVDIDICWSAEIPRPAWELVTADGGYVGASERVDHIQGHPEVKGLRGLQWTVGVDRSGVGPDDVVSVRS